MFGIYKKMYLKVLSWVGHDSHVANRILLGKKSSRAGFLNCLAADHEPVQHPWKQDS